MDRICRIDTKAYYNLLKAQTKFKLKSYIAINFSTAQGQIEVVPGNNKLKKHQDEHDEEIMDNKERHENLLSKLKSDWTNYE